MTNVADSATELMKVEDFLEHLRKGVGPLNACYIVGWTPHHLRRKLQDAAFRELVNEAHERKIEALEETVWRIAERGNLAALQFYLMCQASERGWRPPQHRVAINSESTVRVENVLATKAAILAALETHGIGALQPPAAIEASASDG